MAKKGSSKSSNNILRVSGMVFLGMGVFHVLRYFGIVSTFDFTRLGSLIVGCFLVLLAAGCFAQSK